MYDDYPVQQAAEGFQMNQTGETVIGLYLWIMFFIFFGVMALLQYRVAHKTGNSDTAWWAFIPILNTILLIQMARKPMWWVVLLMIPVVNMVVFFILWIQTAKNAGSSAFWGFLCMFPLINLVALFMIAHGSHAYTYPDFMDDPGPPRPKQPSRVG